jgi:HSP20 family protein|uniref:Hsp20/alpha crystallin family protein n=1 Tax=Candidatus Methanosuratincola petrocarbonis (ex Vanwonterghem et al. 2016) TaxID=1867261 RepID=A0A7J3UXV9_9CREN
MMSYGIDIFDDFRRMMREMERFMGSMTEEMQRRLPVSSDQGFREPLVDINETSDEVIVTAELPGVPKENIELNLTDNTLEIKASQKQEVSLEKGGVRKRERRSMNFYRLIELPCGVDASKVKATFNNGVLEVKMPKLEKAKRHSIKIE